jgi:PLP dependent protein
MTIGSFESSTADGELNPDFEVLVKAREELLEELRRKVESNEGYDVVVKEGLELSMGMSEEFAHAIRQGSSNVRVGSKIFGKRPPKGA